VAKLYASQPHQDLSFDHRTPYPTHPTLWYASERQPNGQSVPNRRRYRYDSIATVSTRQRQSLQLSLCGGESLLEGLTDNDTAS